MPFLYSPSLFLIGLNRFARSARVAKVSSTSDSAGVSIGVRLFRELDSGSIPGSIPGKFDSGSGDDSGVSS
jgi:hypothetical protein